MAELATIARPYAEALHQICGADVSATLIWLDELAGVGAQAEVLRFADNPKVSVKQVYDLICGVMQSSLGPSAQNFLRLIIKNRRLACLPEIAVQLRALGNAASGFSDAVIYSAFPIDEASLSTAVQVLEQKLRRKLKVSVKLQPELIGGIRVVVGDEVIDTSIKARLEQMKVALLA